MTPFTNDSPMRDDDVESVEGDEAAESAMVHKDGRRKPMNKAHPHNSFTKSMQSDAVLVTPRNGTPIEGGLTGRMTRETATELSFNAAETGPSGGEALGRLEDSEVSRLFSGATFQVKHKGAVIVEVGTIPDGLLQVVSGQLQVEVDIPGRLEPEVVGTLGSGDVIGERAFLQGTVTRSRVVVRSAKAGLAKLSRRWLATLEQDEPRLTAKLHLLLASRASRNLSRLLAERHLEIARPDHSSAEVPKTMDEISRNPAFFAIFEQFVALRAPRFLPVMDFCTKVYALHVEANPALLRLKMIELYEEHIEADQAPSPITEAVVSKSLRDRAIFNSLPNPSNQKVSAIVADPKRARHCFDEVLLLCLRALQNGCLEEFYRSPMYKYVLDLKMKQLNPPTLDYFRTFRRLGKGGYGQVLEVEKRDCSRRYAMKVMDKALIAEQYGEDAWERVVVTERKILASLADMPHPLVCQLAYALQNIQFLVLVMDLCVGGDLSQYGVDQPEKLTSEQVRFVGLEGVSMIAHLQRCNIMHRDIKPSNFLIDDSGHIRLVDFGTAKHNPSLSSDDSLVGVAVKPLTSSAYAGTMPYVAPEVAANLEREQQTYDATCDWFSLGTMLYELTEKAYPFGEDPEYEDVAHEFRQPDLRDASGHEIPHLYELLSGLLDWHPTTRLGGALSGIAELQAQYYWQRADWELVDRGTLPSPLVVRARAKESLPPERRGSILDILRPTAEASSESFVKMSKSLGESQSIQRKLDLIEEGKLATDSASESLIEKEHDMYVEGWEFVSERALAQEYLEGLALRASRTAVV